MRRTLSATGLLVLMAASVFALEIHDAAMQGNLERVKELLAANPELLQAKNETGASPLHSATYNNQLAVAEYLLSVGADINALTSQQSCPLHGAAFYGHTEVVKLLISKGARLNQANRSGYVPLLSAAAGGHMEIVKALIEAGADTQARINDGHLNVFLLAVYSGRHQLIDYLLTRGFNIGEVTDEGIGFLHIAVMSDSIEMVKLGLEGGLDPNTRDTSGQTPLHMAMTSLFQRELSPQEAEIIKLLAARGADVNRRDNRGESPLGKAAMANRQEACRLLIDVGADVNNINGDGITPLIYALRNGNVELVQMLLANGARTDVKVNQFGATVLHGAAIYGNLEVVRALEDHVLDFEAKDNFGHTALDYAYKYGHKQIADLLISKGSNVAASSTKAWTPAELATAPREGEVSLYHLGHCGWAMRTTNHFMIFDYFPMAALPTDPSLANGHIVPAELKDLNVEVFITHEHTDHYNPVIFDWVREIPNLTYIFGFRPEDLPEDQRQGYNGQPYEYIGPHENRTIDGMQIKTIKSNDAGVGFLVEVDGLKIFHAGDHAGWENGESEPYTSEIDYLASLVGTVDMAFINTTGCRFARDTLALQQSVFYALDKLSPQVMIPTHGLGREHVYREYAQKIRDHGYKASILCADFLGDRFKFVKANL